MKREYISNMARQFGVWAGYEGEPEYLYLFAEAIAAAERERCAKVCEENCAGYNYDRGNQGPCLTEFVKECGGRHDGMTYAAAIRALEA